MMLDEEIDELKDTYGLKFYDLDYLIEDDREEMIKQIEDLKELCSGIVDKLRDI